MKSFKYFDLNNNGTVEPDEFAKAIEKIGIMIPTQQVSISLSLRFLCHLKAKFSFYTPQTHFKSFILIFNFIS